MKTIKTMSEQEKQLFKDAIGKVKPMVQDTIHAVKTSGKRKIVEKTKNPSALNAEFYFSDQYEAYFNEHEPIKYVADGVNSYEAKLLRNGHYHPEITLDLHGFNQQQAKREIAALIPTCHKEQVECVCIIHGIGSRVLKTKLPHWLVQHPDIKAFHQAPLLWGGAGALLVLLALKDKQD
jgi:DNA-nicking Smr family endonuclease